MRKGDKIQQHHRHGVSIVRQKIQRHERRKVTNPATAEKDEGGRKDKLPHHTTQLGQECLFQHRASIRAQVQDHALPKGKDNNRYTH